MNYLRESSIKMLFLSNRFLSFTITIFIFLLCFLIHFFLSISNLGAKPSSESFDSWFDYAYKIESENPEISRQMYEWYLVNTYTKSTKNKFIQTAYWRLFHLYEEGENFLLAQVLLLNSHIFIKIKFENREIKKLYEKIGNKIKKKFELSQESYILLNESLQLISKINITQGFLNNKIQKEPISQNTLLEENIEMLLKENIQKKNFIRNFLALLMKTKMHSLGLKILETLINENAQTQIEMNFNKITLLIEQKKTSEALYILSGMYGIVPTIGPYEKERYYLLLSKVYKENGNFKEARENYQKAYALGGKNNQAILFQIASCYLLEKKTSQAYKTIYKLPFKKESEEEILAWIISLKNQREKLENSISPKNNAKKELSKFAPYLKAKYKMTKAPIAKLGLDLL